MTEKLEEQIVARLEKGLATLKEDKDSYADASWSDGYDEGYEAALREVERVISNFESREESLEPEQEVFRAKFDTSDLREGLETLALSLVSNIQGAAVKAEREGEKFPLSADTLGKISTSLRDSMNTSLGKAADANGRGSFEKIIGLATSKDKTFERQPDQDEWDEYDPRGKDEILAHEASVANGFWDDLPEDDGPEFLAYVGNKLLLFVGEVIESHEEIRNGRAVDEIYYPTNTENEALPRDSKGVLHKPEGFLVELADVSIRLDDFVGFMHKNYGTPHLYEIKEEKREYNATRGHKHGKKF